LTVTTRADRLALLIALSIAVTSAHGAASLPPLTDTSSRVECTTPVVHQAPGVVIATRRVPGEDPTQPTVPFGGDAFEATVARVQRTPRLAAGLGALVGLLGLFLPMVWWTIREPAARVVCTSAFAFAPFLLGLAAALRVRFAMVESTSQAGYCLPRDLILELGAFDVFDAVILGALASVPLLWVMLGTLVAARKVLRKALVVPAALASVSCLGTWALKALLDRDRAALDAPSDFLRRLDVSLPTASTHRGTALPDLPIVTIDEAGAASYADRAMGFRREPLPPLFRPPARPSPVDEAPPPALILAVDRRTPFAAVEAALKPLVERGHGHYELAYAYENQRPTVAIDAFSGAKSRAAEGLWGTSDLHVHVRIDEHGVGLFARGASIAPGCRDPGAGPTLPGNPSAEAIRECVTVLKDGAKAVDLGERVWVLAAPGVPFGAVAAAVDVLVTNGLFSDAAIGYEEEIPARVLQREERQEEERRMDLDVTSDVTRGTVAHVDRSMSRARGRIRYCAKSQENAPPATGRLRFNLALRRGDGDESAALSREDVTVSPVAGGQFDAAQIECVRLALKSLSFSMGTPTAEVRGEIRLERGGEPSP
jgi:hypothetical protein